MTSENMSRARREFSVRMYARETWPYWLIPNNEKPLAPIRKSENRSQLIVTDHFDA